MPGEEIIGRFQMKLLVRLVSLLNLFSLIVATENPEIIQVYEDDSDWCPEDSQLRTSSIINASPSRYALAASAITSASVMLASADFMPVPGINRSLFTYIWYAGTLVEMWNARGVQRCNAGLRLMAGIIVNLIAPWDILEILPVQAIWLVSVAIIVLLTSLNIFNLFFRFLPAIDGPFAKIKKLD